MAYETSEVRPQVTGLIRAPLFHRRQHGPPGPAALPDRSQPLSGGGQPGRGQSRERPGDAPRPPRRGPTAIDRWPRWRRSAKQDYTDAAAQARAARAAVAQNAAALETARINLRFTTIPAPISGRIGRSLFTVGALVSANQPDPLAVIQRLDPIYVDIQQSSAELLALRGRWPAAA